MVSGINGEATIFVQDSSSTWHQISTYTSFKVLKRQNQASEFEVLIEDIESSEKAYVKEFAKIIFFSDTNLLLKGRIQKVEYKTGYSCSISGYGMEALLLEKELIKNSDKRVQYTTTSAENIAREILSENTDGSSPWIIEPNSSTFFDTAYGNVGLRFEYANRLNALGKESEAINYEWGVSHSGDYETDYFNMDTLLPSTTLATVSQKTYNISGANANCNQTGNKRDVTNLANKIDVLGYGDGINQISVSTYNASSTYSILSADITSASTTITLDDASSFSSSGEIRIMSERITYTGKSGNQLTGCTRGANSTTAKPHKKNVFVEKYVAIGSAEVGSSIGDNSLLDYTITERNFIDEETAELVASHELLRRKDVISRITLVPDEPSEDVGDLDIGYLITIEDAEADLSNDYRIVAINYYSEYGSIDVEFECSNRTLTFIEQMNREKQKADNLGKYMQGSTNIYAISEAENCDSDSKSQLTGTNVGLLFSGWFTRFAQRTFISGQTPNSLSFKLAKTGSPTGNVTFAIRKYSDDSVIDSNTITASSLTTDATERTVTLTGGTEINEEVYVSVEYSGGDGSNNIKAYYANSDVLSNEILAKYYSGSWVDDPDSDLYYAIGFSDPNYLNMRFFLPNETIALNRVLLNFKLKPFRSYTQVSESNQEETIISSTTASSSSTTVGSSFVTIASTTLPAKNTKSTRFNIAAILDTASGNPSLTGGQTFVWRLYDGTNYYPDSSGISLCGGQWKSGVNMNADYQWLSGVDRYVIDGNLQGKTMSLQLKALSSSGTNTFNFDGYIHYEMMSGHRHEMNYGISEKSLSSESVDLYTGEDGGTMTLFDTYSSDQTEIDITDEISTIGAGKWVNLQFRPNQSMRIEANAYIQIFINSE